MPTIISVENLSKSYRLGQIGTGTFAHDLSVWWAKVRGKPNPVLKIGEEETGGRETGRPSSVLGPQSPILWALKDVSFTVEQGEVLGIIGRNGAGKSTLLKILSRVTAPTSGRIRVKGRVASLLEVGTGFHPELTGRENVYLNGAILGMTKQEVTRKFDEIVDFAEVEKFIDTPVKRYSSGMYVRLAFAVAAHLEPEILVVDEVLAVGDAEFQKKCLGKMGEVAHEGRTVLFVSHNMAAISKLCEKCVHIENGQIRNLGETRQVIQEYLVDNNSNEFYVNFDYRQGSKKYKNVSFKWAKLADVNGKGCRKFSIGEDIAIEFEIGPRKDFLGNKVKLAVEIRTSDGQNICNIVDVDSEFGISKIEHRVIVSILFKDIRFYPDTYFISLWAGSITSTEVYDYERDCLSFEIIGGGQLTTRRLPRSAGLLFLTPEWTTKDEA